jgi:alpha-tubulin suppressor-like RCC1 family protein
MLVFKGKPCSLRPVPVAGGLRFRAIEAGSYHACGLTDEGRAYCWGRATLGELGRSDVPRRCRSDFEEPCTDIPVAVGTDLRFSTISAADAFTCALTLEGVPYCWGINKDGVYGDGNITNGDPRVSRIAAPTTFVQLSSWGSQTCALSPAGEVYCWGEALSADARHVALPARAVSVSRGWRHTCALLADSTGYCWGYNDSGELGIKPNRMSHEAQTAPVRGTPPLDSLLAGFSNTCGISRAHELYCWGSGGTLGARAKDRCFHVDAWDSCTWTPTRVAIEPVQQVTFGFMHACAIVQSGAALCWGYNDAGALGTGNRRGSVEPTPVGTRDMK